VGPLINGKKKERYQVGRVVLIFEPNLAANFEPAPKKSGAKQERTGVTNIRGKLWKEHPERFGKPARERGHAP